MTSFYNGTVPANITFSAFAFPEQMSISVQLTAIPYLFDRHLAKITHHIYRAPIVAAQ